MELVFATNNAHKLQEVQQLIGTEFTLKSLADINCFDDIPETGDTFLENAKQKTDYLFNKYQVNCFGDDSGLVVEALNGQPGVYSARYSGSRDMQRNIDLVLEKLVNNPNRKASFKTVISLQFQTGDHYYFEGTIHGRIIENRVGSEGFGYDPIFIPDGYHKTFAEMSLEEKNKISHRAMAISKLVAFLTTQK